MHEEPCTWYSVSLPEVAVPLSGLQALISHLHLPQSSSVALIMSLSAQSSPASADYLLLTRSTMRTLYGADLSG